MTSGRRSRIAAQVARATQAAKAQAQGDAGLIPTQTLPAADVTDAGASTYAAASCIPQVDVPIDPVLQALSVQMPPTITQDGPPAHEIEIPIAPELLMDDYCTRVSWNPSAGLAKEMENNGDWGAEGRHEGAQMKMKGYAGRGSGDGDDSEWEYDWNDCEVYYVNLDVTIPTPLFSHLAPTAAGAGRGTTTSANASAQTSSSKSPEDRSAQLNDHTPKHHTRYPHKFQLSSLASQNPLVSYHNRIYSCEWAEPLGTEMFIESTTPAYSSTSTLTSSLTGPIHSGTSSVGKLVGISQTRLHGYPAIVVPKEGGADHRLTRVDKGGKIAQGESGMAGRTGFWKRLEEVKKRRKEEEEGEGGKGSGNAGESGGGESPGVKRRENTEAGGTEVLIGNGSGFWVPTEYGIGRGEDRTSHCGKGKMMGGGTSRGRDAEDEEESNEDSDVNSDEDDEYEFGDDGGSFGAHQEHQQRAPVGVSINPRQHAIPHPGIVLDAPPVMVTDTCVDPGRIADTEGDIEMGGTLR